MPISAQQAIDAVKTIAGAVRCKGTEKMMESIQKHPAHYIDEHREKLENPREAARKELKQFDGITTKLTGHKASDLIIDKRCTVHPAKVVGARKFFGTENATEKEAQFVADTVKNMPQPIKTLHEISEQGRLMKMKPMESKLTAHLPPPPQHKPTPTIPGLPKPASYLEEKEKYSPYATH